jgi:OOP family OmpA-OmpF porin
MRSGLPLLSLLLLDFVGALAQSSDVGSGHVVIAPFRAFADEARRTPNDGSGMQTTFGRLLTERWGWEATFSYATLDTGDAGGTDYYQTSFGLDFSRRFSPRIALTPVVWFGAGFVDNDVYPDSEDSVDPYLSAAFGVVSRPLGESGTALRARAVYLYDDFKAGMHDWRLELGVSIPLGRTRIVERVVEREVPVEAPPRVVDLPPPDDDGDGVADNIDRCPNSLSGAAVDATGCIREAQAVELAGVNFEFGSARLTESAQRILDRAFLSLRDQPDIYVEIAGHTDSVGSDVANLALSNARAEAVRVFLLSRGIAPERMTFRGYGESQPLTSEVTDEERARNRRVEFRIQPRRP